MKLKRDFLKPMLEFLATVKVGSAKQQRKFAAFRRLLGADLDQYFKDLQEIQEKYMERDENDKPITKTNDKGQTTFSIPKDKTKEYDNDMKELMEEEFIWEKTETNKDTYETVYKIVEELDMEMSGIDLIMYDELCTAFDMEEIPV